MATKPVNIGGKGKNILSLPADVHNYLCELTPVILPLYRRLCRRTHATTARAWQKYKATVPVTQSEKKSFFVKEMLSNLTKIRALIEKQEEIVKREATFIENRKRVLDGKEPLPDVDEENCEIDEEEFNEDSLYNGGCQYILSRFAFLKPPIPVRDARGAKGSAKKGGAAKKAQEEPIPDLCATTIVITLNKRATLTVGQMAEKHVKAVERDKDELIESTIRRFIRIFPHRLILRVTDMATILTERGLVKPQLHPLLLRSMEEDLKCFRVVSINFNPRNNATKLAAWSSYIGHVGKGLDGWNRGVESLLAIIEERYGEKKAPKEKPKRTRPRAANVEDLIDELEETSLDETEETSLSDEADETDC